MMHSYAFGSANSYTLSFVLILVLMDDALVRGYQLDGSYPSELS